MMRMPQPSVVVPYLAAAVVALLVLGPALGPGVVLAYDLAWSPDARFTPFAVGSDGSVPRALPSDAVAIVLGHLLGAGLAQSVVLFATLVLAGVGAVRLAVLLAPDLSPGARVVAVIAAIWNPFVLERLVIGHWTVLLAYAAVPHLLVACAAVRRDLRPPWTPAVGVAACGVGGANALVIAALTVLVALSVPRTQWQALAYAGGATVSVSLVWALPAALTGVASSPLGVPAFAATADTPLGVLASVATGGGLWNPATHPAERSSALVAVGALVLAIASAAAGLRAARAAGLLALAVPAVVGLLLAWSSAVDPLGLWSAIVLHLPGGGVLRDAQKLIAPWVAVTAAGAGVLARDIIRLRGAGPALAVLLAALPVALLPSLAWGVGGRVTAVEVPTDLRSTSANLSTSGEGSVGLLPWSQYRRYEWNGQRVSLTLVPRMVDHPVLFDDSLPLTSGSVPGESAAARRVGERIDRGVVPLQALASEGVRWVFIEKRAGLPVDEDLRNLPTGARVVQDGPSATVVELDTRGATAPRMTWGGLIGWVATCATWLVAAACLARDSRRRRRDRLIGSPS
jgi:hypothetical protein